MSLHLSPETEQVKAKLHTNWNDLLNHARQLERERNEAREKYNNLATENMLAVNKLCNERDEAREDQKNSRQSLAVAIEELDEAREALMKIEQLFIDGTDVYADREKMATIAIEALEVAK